MKRFLAILLVFAAVLSLVGCGEDKPVIEWSSLQLAEHLPDPELTLGEVSKDEDWYLHVTINDVDEAKNEAYVDACIEVGYTIDAERNPAFMTPSYEAYNEEGYHLYISWYQNKLTIRLTAPIEMGEFVWPTSGLGTRLPATESTVGVITENSDQYFRILVGNMTVEECAEYIDACIALGFVRLGRPVDGIFTGEDEQGYCLFIDYLGFNTVQIEIYPPAKNNAT